MRVSGRLWVWAEGLKKKKKGLPESLRCATGLRLHPQKKKYKKKRQGSVLVVSLPACECFSVFVQEGRSPLISPRTRRFTAAGLSDSRVSRPPVSWVFCPFHYCY